MKMEEWKEVRLEECVSLLGDGLHGTPKYTENGEYAFINGNNLTNGRIVIKPETKRINEDEYLKYKKNLTDRTIFVSINGTIGNVGTYNGEKIILGKSACYFNVLDDIDKTFIKYIVSSPSFKTYLETNATGTTIKNVSLAQMRNYSFLLPPLPTQQKIATILSSLDDKIELNNKINTNLEQQAQALFKNWFVDFEPFGGKMPGGWKVGKLSEILCLKKNPIQPGEDTSLPYLPIDLIPIKSLAIREVRPNEEALSSLLRFDENDILIGAMRVYFHRVAIAPFEGITRTTCFVLEPFDPSYFAYGAITCNQDLAIDYAQKTSKGSTMPYAVWEGGLGDFEIPIPDEATAAKFNNIVKPLLEQIKKSYFENETLQELRESLLPKLMNGEIDVDKVIL